MRRARHVEVGQVDRQQRVGRRGRQLDRHLVDRFRAAQVRHARRGDADLTHVEVRRILLQHLLDVPHHGVGVEVRAVVEFHAGSQLEDPLGLVGRRNRPFGRDAGDHHARLVGRREVPGGETLIHRVAGEAVALEALVGLADGLWNVGRRHADAHHGLRRRGGQADRKQRGRKRRRRHQQTRSSHCKPPDWTRFRFKDCAIAAGGKSGGWRVLSARSGKRMRHSLPTNWANGNIPGSDCWGGRKTRA